MSQYLVICNTLLPAPPEVMDAFIAQCDYMDELIKKSTVKMFVPFSGINGGFFVADVSSNEGLSKIISGCPMFPYVSREIYPLSDDNELKKIITEMKKRMSK
jgi:muconolactone delta-isomerase